MKLSLEEGFDIIEAARMEYGFGKDERRVSEAVQRLQDGKGTEEDVSVLRDLGVDMKCGILNGRQNAAIRAIERLNGND